MLVTRILLASEIAYTPTVCRQLHFTHTTLFCVVVVVELSSHTTSDHVTTRGGLTPHHRSCPSYSSDNSPSVLSSQAVAFSLLCTYSSYIIVCVLSVCCLCVVCVLSVCCIKFTLCMFAFVYTTMRTAHHQVANVAGLLWQLPR